ncbi:MAG TPA: hypothetical protein DIU39_06505 [Flavobacteriales bacterium]|nr:hypothetical protein [Flavobacteriales bacterium]|tara:strand:+ start:40147 stop:41268 length:1122 start_codon:yes stop_codon:yes gene_type:complete
MTKNNIQISDFKKSNNFLPSKIQLAVTIKSFDLQAIRQRYIQSVKTGKGTVGSVEKRPSHLGGLAFLTIENGKIINEEMPVQCKEPRGIDIRKNTFAFSSENKVIVTENDKTYTCENPWFSYIHTVKLSPFNPDLLLLSSSGLDTIFEINFKIGEVVREWCAWENGFNISYYKNEGTLFLTRNKEEAAQFKKEGLNYLYIENPAEDFLPTAKRAAFINSVAYHPTDENKILATFFHEGTVREIDLNSGKSTIVLDGMNSPHGGMMLNSNTLMVTNTRGGEVLLKQNDAITAYDFKQLPGKPDYLQDKEWIQNSAFYGDNIISIDSNRNSFVIFNPKTKEYILVPYNENWAVQDIIAGDFNLLQTIDFQSLQKL